MKITHFIFITTLAALLLFIVPKGKAQDEMTIFINESVEDAENVMKAYGSPLLRSLDTNFRPDGLTLLMLRALDSLISAL
ncbi:MAG: hypothetical protein U5L09_09365 [Bacteroidales bacterium]|nr:hypothetical protein [Bacteroidales bacterium]